MSLAIENFCVKLQDTCQTKWIFLVTCLSWCHNYTSERKTGLQKSQPLGWAVTGVKTL